MSVRAHVLAGTFAQLTNIHVNLLYLLLVNDDDDDIRHPLHSLRYTETELEIEIDAKATKNLFSAQINHVRTRIALSTRTHIQAHNFFCILMYNRIIRSRSRATRSR